MLLVEDNEREGKTRLWFKRRQEKDYFANIVQELMIEDVAGYREMLNRSSPSPSMSFLVISLSFYRIQIARHFPPCLQMTFKKASASVPRRNIVARTWLNDYNIMQHPQM